MNFQTIIPYVQVLTPILAITISTISVVINSRIGARAARMTREIAMERERPYVAIYYHSIPKCDYKTIIIKNFGRTGAHIKDITFEPNLNDYQGTPIFSKLIGSFIAPTQSISYAMQSSYIENLEQKEYKVTAVYYNSRQYTYTETFNINFGSEVEFRDTYRNSDNTDQDISYTLQDIYRKMI